MKKLNIFLYAFLLITVSAWSQSNSVENAAIGLVVSDLEASEAFYKEIVGMEVFRTIDLDENWSKEAKVANGRPFKLTMLKQKNMPAAAILKLVSFGEVNDLPEMSGIDVRAGVNYITFHYDLAGYNEVTSRVNKAGIPIIGEVKTEYYQLFFVKDPDGLFVEIFGPPEG